MIYDHMVKKNGKYYHSGENVPDLIENNSYTSSSVSLEKKEFNRTDINRMSTAELRDFALKNGIENADSITGSELKKILIEKFEL